MTFRNSNSITSTTPPRGQRRRNVDFEDPEWVHRTVHAEAAQGVELGETQLEPEGDQPGLLTTTLC
jgi:hypothetical protein